MSEAANIRLPRVGLQTPEHEELLNIIDTLRSQGIGRYVDLPQLIVCGDQSSGKSSVLEAISGLPFPTKDNLCTRFATELILRRGSETHMKVTINPGSDRNDADTRDLSRFKAPSASIAKFESIVKAAEKAMGLDGSSKGFSRDTLRVELCGPQQPHLTLVDLPGIFWAGDRSQSDGDATLVKELVKSYMEKARSIILAVVSAKSDLAMQVITKLSREIDPQGDRTLGIITKPDLLHAGSDSEETFVKLARNENIYFKLGWHVLKNRDYDTRNASRAERDASERDFFKNRVWSNAVSKTKLGIEHLRPRLSNLLLNQILSELPNLKQDVERELQQCKDRLEALGGPRGTLSEQRVYLTKASQTFATLMQAAVDGIYVNAFFDLSDPQAGYSKRLRAVVQYRMTEFAEKMASEGHARSILDTRVARPASNPRGPEVTTRDKYLESVMLRIRRNRGTELPGLFNPSIVGDLFFEQAKPWKDLLKDTEADLLSAAKTTVDLVLEHAADNITKAGIMRHIVRPNMEPICAKLSQKTDEVLQPHTRGHPLTFNDQFTVYFQKKRHTEARRLAADTLRSFFNVNPYHQDGGWIKKEFQARNLLDALNPDVEQDTARFAAIEATNAMEAYYKVAMKSLIDAFGMYAIEACLLEDLPKLFSPERVAELDDATITKIAGESAESIAEREELQTRFRLLTETMVTLRRLRNFGRSPE